ncbi:hypothetical protein [Anaerosalibacter sp. Marseille-P3206]|uniref:hypothetical protein n=1 Tax=Anaerosalibacter sp. Marseille-P3206 TaxID=1871005 RepID=UPI000984DC83|nr:hypothetical protein [Anaerosalibacter sp. Marseille-P3206]
MVKIKSKEEVLREYQSRYEELDSFFIEELSKEYDRYAEKLKDVDTKEEAIDMFRKEVKRNERRYKQNTMNASEASLHGQFMDILAQYGLIKFFRDNILEE